MNKKLLIRVIVVFGIAVATLFLIAPLAVAALAIWIYLVWMVWKKRTNIFHDQMEQKLAERRYKMLKVLLLVAGVSLAFGIVGVILHNALYGLSEMEEPASFFFAFLSLWVFTLATIGSLVIFIKGREHK
jgi:hypothetical protein